MVAHPPHYNSGRVEVIEGIEEWDLGFHLGNAVKYIARCGKKDPEKWEEDIEKAIWYLRRYVEIRRAKEVGRTPIKPNSMTPGHNEDED